MCGRNCKICSCKNNFNTCCCNYRGCSNRCYDFILPMMFWMIRDCNRCCRCGFVNRYDLYR